MDIYHTLIRPLVTEKGTRESQRTTPQRGGAYRFEVHRDANKAEIKDAVEKIYGVTVLRVNTINSIGKRRRFRFRQGKLHPMKKAIVYVAPDQAIELF